MGAVASDIQTQISAIGRELLAGARTKWSASDWLLGLMTRDETARLNALRFVDVLPALTDDASVVSHMKEYFGDEGLPIPIPGIGGGLGRFALGLAGGGIGAKVMAGAVRTAVGTMARRFIAGETVDEVTTKLASMKKEGLDFTLDLLGETTISEAEADDYQKKYDDILLSFTKKLAAWKEPSKLKLAIKLSSLCSQMAAVDEDRSVEMLKVRLRLILQHAREVNAEITFDMEAYNYKNITLRVFKELLLEPAFKDWPDAGIAMQAYLRDTPADVEAMIAFAQSRGTPILVRLVRGAYWDYETVIARQNGWPIPVWSKKEETDASYEHCLRLLLAAYPAVRTAAATHNVRSMAVAMAAAQAAGLSPDKMEFQMLYGMADEVKTSLVKQGQSVVVYTPFGDLLPGMSYFVRRLLENTASQSFLRMAGMEKVDETELLKAPGPLAGGIVMAQQKGFVNETPRRFTAPAERRAFAAAIEQVRASLGRKVPLLIAGKNIETVTENSTDPAKPSRVVGQISVGTPDHASAAIAAAEAAFDAWSSKTAAERAAILKSAADKMAARRDQLSAWQIFETAKPWREADADVCEAIDFLRFYADEALRLSNEQNLDRAGESNAYRYEPRGVGVVIGPWNFPLAIITGMVAAAIVTGNTVVLKPAPQSPVNASLLVEILTEAGLPPGVLNFLPGNDGVGEALVADPRVAFVAFTGSEAVGKAINAAGALVHPGQTHIKRIIAEMGGKNAIIIDDDADLDEAVAGVVESAFGYAGQKCSACSRVIIVGNAYEDVVKRIAAAAASIKVGLPEEPGTIVSPVIDAEAQSRIRNAIDAGKKTARLVLERTGPEHGIPTEGSFVGPTVFADVPPTSPLFQEEIFGPVLAITRANTFDEALTLANATRFALTGGLFSRSPNHLALARKKFRVGNLYLNRKITGAIVAHQPFGGFKMSGVGSKAGGLDYLLQFTEPRCVTENIIRRGFSPDVE